jgi:protein-serine/threonine kinase
VDWDLLHAQVPPFIPRIREDQSITKYFEDEKDILGSESESVTSVDYSDCAPAHPADGGDDVPARIAAALPRIFAAGADVAGATSAAEALAARASVGRASAEDGSAGGDGDGDARAALEWLARQDARALKALWERRRQQVQRPADGWGEAPPQAQRPAAAGKRARDKILRDPKMYRTAMHVRKRYAFMGYTYRRPHYVRRGGGAAVLGKGESVVSGVGSRP